MISSGYLADATALFGSVLCPSTNLVSNSLLSIQNQPSFLTAGIFMMIESIVKYNVGSPIQINGFLFGSKDSIKSQASSVKTVMVAHQQLIGEVKAMLTTMAKVTRLPLMFRISLSISASLQEIE